jgi:Glycosyltransferase family 87
VSRASRTMPVLRAVGAIGADGLARYAAIVALVLAVVFVAAEARPELTRPSDLGTDASNYYAAGLRLESGTSLYSLSAGDRPVSVDDPPGWSVPLLSPPTIAVAWRVLAGLPPGILMTGWWLLGGGLALAMVAISLLRLPGLLSLLLVPTLPFVAITALSGNVNPWLMALVVVVWFLVERGPTSGRWPVVAGCLVAVAAAVKLAPILIAWWLIVRGHWRAFAACIVALVVIGAITIVGAGGTSVIDYMHISQQTALAGSTGWSVGGQLQHLGAPASVVSGSPIVVALGTAALVLVVRRSARWSFLLAIIGMSYVTPVVRGESLVVLIAGLAPWWGTIRFGRLRVDPRHVRWAVVGGVAALFLVGIVVTLSSRTSSLVARNLTNHEVTVRVGAAAQSATFGFRIPPLSEVRGYTAVTGAISGVIAVYGERCVQLARFESAPAGGLVTVAADGQVTLAPDPGTVDVLAPYVPDCAGSGTR